MSEALTPQDANSRRVVKHSVVIAGHRTSVSLEDAFWRALKDIATQEGISLAALIARVDAGRGEANLSSALRVFVLERALGVLEPLPVRWPKSLAGLAISPRAVALPGSGYARLVFYFNQLCKKQGAV